MSISLRTVTVSSNTPYDIRIGPTLLEEGAALATHIRGKHVLIVSDTHVAPLYAERLIGALRVIRSDVSIASFIITAGESSKTLENFGRAIEALAALGANRDSTVFALGGGVVGDLAGFAAACWMRGVDCVQLPTSLLAMVDSSVGGKTAVDIPEGKNLVGAFHPPTAVFADTATLTTLPERELRAGLAEVVKYGAIRDADFFSWLTQHVEELLAHDAIALTAAIARSCEHKAEIVANDPFERGERALLNFGHTFAHAIEAEQGYSSAEGDALNHGEAVAVGMVLAARLSAELGMASEDDTAQLIKLLQSFALPVALPRGLNAQALLSRMRLDKKNLAGRLRLILWRGIGRALIVADIDEHRVLELLQQVHSHAPG